MKFKNLRVFFSSACSRSFFFILKRALAAVFLRRLLRIRKQGVRSRRVLRNDSTYSSSCVMTSPSTMTRPLPIGIDFGSRSMSAREGVPCAWLLRLESPETEAAVDDGPRFRSAMSCSSIDLSSSSRRGGVSCRALLAEAYCISSSSTVNGRLFPG